MAKVEMQCFRCDNIFWVDEEDFEKKRKCPNCGSEHNVFERSEMPDPSITSGEDRSTTEQDDGGGDAVRQLTVGLMITALVGTVLLVAAIITFTKTLIFLRTAVKTSAVIIEIREKYSTGTADSLGGYSYALVSTYKDSKGQTYENVPDTWQSHLPARY